jgi:hypothetical protein
MNYLLKFFELIGLMFVLFICAFYLSFLIIDLSIAFIKYIKRKVKHERKN